MRIVLVPKGKVAPVIVNGEGHFLREGRHFINSPRFELLDIHDLSKEYIAAGTRHRIIVPAGKLGLAFEQGEPVQYDPGSIHLVNSALFEYRGSVSVTEQIIKQGSITIVMVRDGQVGITYNDGVLQLLEPGRHTLDKATHILQGFVATGQRDPFHHDHRTMPTANAEPPYRSGGSCLIETFQMLPLRSAPDSSH